MIGWLKLALGMGSGISWITYAVLFGLGFAAGGAGTGFIIYRGWAVPAEAKMHEAQTKDIYHEADAARWQGASALRDQAITILTGKLAEQSAAAEKERFAREQADRIAAKAERDSRDAQAAFDQRVQEIEEEAKAAPADVRSLGPIATKRIPQLWQ